MEAQLTKTGGEIEEIKSLMVNQGLNCINPRPRIKLQKLCKSEADVEVPQGPNCIKSKVQGQLRVQLKPIKSWKTKLKINKNP